MKRILHLDQNYQQLRLLNFFNSGLPQFCYENVRKYVETILTGNGNKSRFKDLVRILRKQNQCTVQSLKNLMFYNAVIYEALKKPSQNLENVVSEQINNIVALENTRYQQILQGTNRKNKSKGFSIDKATNWMRQTFSRSKDKKEVKLNRAMSQIEKNLKNKSIQSLQKATASTNKNQSVDYTQVKNKQQLLIPKIILPYAAYLLKLNSCQTNFQQQIISPNIQTEQIWKIINLMKYLMKITHCFTLLMRYYSEHYQITIRSILNVIDFELKNLYPFIKTFIGMRLKQIKKQILDVYGKCPNKRQQMNMLQKIIHKYQMNQIKRIIEEVLIINDQITSVYRGKYTFYLIKSMNIPPLTILTQNDQHYDLVFDVLQSVSKNKSQDKKQNIQKQRNKQAAQEPKRKSSQIKQTIPQQGSKKFAQKKLKIVTETNKTTSMTAINIIKPNSQQFISNLAAVPEKQESAFRKMRLNTTKQNIHLEQSKQSNTRRLRL